MALSSSSSATPQVKYDVFLSFRGEDTRNNFTSHLYAALTGKGIKTFIDNQLPRGDAISSSLLDTIKASKISVIIFSENYAASRWCLKELEQIFDCRGMNGQIVIPVFHHIDPSDVRNATGSFGGAFVQLQDRFKDEMPRWKAALKEAGNLSGHVTNTEKPQSVLIENIVDDILDKLEDLSSIYHDDLVGVGSRIEEIVSKLQIDSGGLHVLGIWGIGGIGKTTISKAVFNRIQKHFDSYYFAEDVREKSERSSERTYLQKELFSAILDDHRSYMRLSTLMKERLGQKKVLIVFDDVTRFEQIVKLIGNPNCLGSGSRIIITTRDKHVLKSCEINSSNIYEVEGLSSGHALQLFTKHAFGKTFPPRDYVQLSNRMIAYAKGVPLALQVLGSFLYGRTEQDWESAMKKLDKCLHSDVQHVLKISYDGLDEDDRKIFLDIACFFKGCKSDRVKDILGANDFFTEVGFNNLIDKRLITISNDIIMMHDLLQEMGKTIVRTDCNDLGKYSRLWKHEDIYNVLRKNSGTEAIEGISLDISKIRDINLKPYAFEKMHNLRIFMVYNSHGQDDYQNKLLGFEDLETFSMELTYFSWERYPYKSLPANFHAENLVILHMPYSKIEQLWNGVQNLVKLKHVDLSDSIYLTNIPDLSKATNLQELILRDCRSLVSLPEGIQSKFITLKGCTILITVPKISCKVEHLDLSGTAIRESPYIEQPSKLVTLNLSDCSRLEILSSSISKCKYLEDLSLERSSRHRSLPDDVGNLETSETLISHGNVIRKAIASIVHLTKRQRIRYQKPVNWAVNSLSSFFKRPRLADRQIMKLPEDLGQLSLLKKLNLSGNNFESMPISIKNLSHLEFLDISNCGRLVVLPELPSGLDLAAYNCSSLESISNSSFLFSCSLRSQSVNLSNCYKLNLSENLHKESPQKICGNLCYIGNEIPGWFQYQNIGAFVTLELPPNWMNENLIGFNICAVVACSKGHEDPDYDIFCTCIIKDKNNEIEAYRCCISYWNDSTSPRLKFLGSEHVFVGFVYGMTKFISMRVSRDELTESNSRVVFSFFPLNIGYEVKKCGIQFLYDDDYCSSFMISNKEEEDEQHSSSRPEFVPTKGTVNDILEGFNKPCPSNNKHPVGVEIAVQEIESLLQIGSDGVCVVGILGDQGVGKTTIAQVILDKILTEFEGFCFFEDYSEFESMHTCLSKVLDAEDTNIEYWLKHKRLLFIFDGQYVDKDAINLMQDPARSCSGSRIIVTSTSRDFFKTCGIKEKHIYEVKSLCHDNSLQLFSKYAFGQDHPSEGYAELSEVVHKHVFGNPLALKILGSCLFGKIKQDWEHVVDILQSHEKDTTRERIDQVLKISYDFLNVETESVFSGVASVRDCWYGYAVKTIFNTRGISAQNRLSDLIDRCLITIKNNSIITVPYMVKKTAPIDSLWRL